MILSNLAKSLGYGRKSFMRGKKLHFTRFKLDLPLDNFVNHTFKKDYFLRRKCFVELKDGRYIFIIKVMKYIAAMLMYF